MKCQGKTRAGAPCNQNAIRGRNWCRLHGGHAGQGAAAPGFKHGGYSAFLPRRLKDRYLEALGDDELMSMRQDVALHEVHIQECCRRLQTGECGTLWDDVTVVNRNLQAAVTSGDVIAMRLGLQQLDALTTRGGDVLQAWKDLADAVRDKADAVRAESSRLAAQNQTITAPQAAALVIAVSEAVRRNVTNPAELRAVQQDLMKLFNIGISPNVDVHDSPEASTALALPAPSAPAESAAALVNPV